MERKGMPRIIYALVSVIFMSFVQSIALPQAHAAPRDVTITLSADDNLSGVVSMQIAENKDNPPAEIPYNRTAVVTTDARTLWVRVKDRALNWSEWVEVVVGGAPVIHDPLAKTVYVPVALVPYVPPTNATPPTQPQTSGGGSAPSGGGSAPSGGGFPSGISESSVAVLGEKEVDPATEKKAAKDSETKDAGSAAATPTPDKSVIAAPPAKVEVEQIAKAPAVAPAPAPTGIKQVSSGTKAATSLSLTSTTQPKVALNVNSVLEVKLPTAVGSTTVTVSVTDSLGKKLSLPATVDKKTGKITLPKVAFGKSGTYQLTAIVGKKISKLTIVVR